VKAAGR